MGGHLDCQILAQLYVTLSLFAPWVYLVEAVKVLLRRVDAVTGVRVWSKLVKEVAVENVLELVELTK